MVSGFSFCSAHNCKVQAQVPRFQFQLLPIEHASKRSPACGPVISIRLSIRISLSISISKKFKHQLKQQDQVPYKFQPTSLLIIVASFIGFHRQQLSIMLLSSLSNDVQFLTSRRIPVPPNGGTTNRNHIFCTVCNRKFSFFWWEDRS